MTRSSVKMPGITNPTPRIILLLNEIQGYIYRVNRFYFELRGTTELDTTEIDKLDQYKVKCFECHQKLETAQSSEAEKMWYWEEEFAHYDTVEMLRTRPKTVNILWKVLSPFIKQNYDVIFPNYAPTKAAERAELETEFEEAKAGAEKFEFKSPTTHNAVLLDSVHCIMAYTNI